MSVRIESICVKEKRISAEVFVNEDKNDVWYEFPQNVKQTAVRPANAFLVAFMPIAMRTGGPLEIRGAISKRLYESMHEYQDIMKKWYPELNRIEIYADEIKDDLEEVQGRKVISCFTGGVDAFYTLIKNEKKIDDLLYVWGFDLPLTEDKFYAQIRKHMADVAEAFDKNIVFVKTNLGFEVTNKYASWGDYCYGAAIASVILLMTDKYRLCLMPSCNDYSVLVPRGSHVLINHLWGCDGVEFVYDGAEASRVEKVDRIADNEIVQKHLRVCYMTNSNYNCCECEKCIRTMVSLEALGKLDKVSTFYKPLVIEKVSETKLTNDSELGMAEASLSVAIKNNKSELAEQLKKQIIKYKFNALIRDLNENLEILLNDEEFKEVSLKIVRWNIEHNTKYTMKKFLKTAVKKVKMKLLRK